MESKEKLQHLRTFDEAQLIDNAIIPLLEEMGFRNITKTHTQSERGLDLVFCKKTEFNDREYTGVQVKAKKIHGSSSRAGNATEILNQAQEAFFYSFPDVYDGTPKNIDRYIVMTSGDINPGARTLIKEGLKKVGCYKTIHFYDGKKLVELIDQYVPSFFWEEYDCFNRYFNAMKSEFETIKDVTAVGRGEPIPLEDIYVSLKLSEKREFKTREKEPLEEREYKLEEDIDRKHLMEEKEYLIEEKKHLIEEEHKREQILDADDAVKRFDRMVIVGDPGSGKTTLLKHVALKSCKENLEKQERVIVPVLIELRQFSESGKDLRTYINDVLDRYDFPGAEKVIEKDLKKGRCQVLLDGFDELATSERQHEVITHIETFMREYPKNRFVVTSRSAGYRDELKGFEKLELMEFTDKQIETFITNWFGKINPEKAKKMNTTIKDNEKIRAIARNPLMITIIAVIYEEDRELPQRRVELYKRCVEVLLT